MRWLAFALIASPLSIWPEEEPLKLPELWHTIIPSPKVETLYLRATLLPRRSAIFTDLGKAVMPQSPYKGGWNIDPRATIWSSDLQILEFFQQSHIAKETIDFNF